MNTTNQSYLDNKEYLKISTALQDYHSLFYHLLKIGRPRFSTEVPTAAVKFNEDGDVVSFILNEEFWNTQSFNQKCFIICHEISHIFLNHGGRGSQNLDSTANKAMDVVVNHLLVNSFGFDREKIDPTNLYCWIDTVFSNPKQVKEDQSFEYYYNLLKQEKNEQNNNSSSEGKGESSEGKGGGQLVDDHSYFKNSEKILKEVSEKLTNEEKQIISNILDQIFPKYETSTNNSGNESNGSEYFVPKIFVKKKSRWETIIKKWAMSVITDNTDDQWLRSNRRTANFNNKEIFIPSEMESIGYEVSKIQVWFFQDTSGSCVEFADRFFKAAESLPKDRFEVKMHCFDTRVYETSLESRKLYGFGGTAFNIIEDYIQNYIKKHKIQYPKKVWVITDGYGNAVNPEFSNRWDWFLTQNSISSFIPKKSKIYKLEDYE